MRRFKYGLFTLLFIASFAVSSGTAYAASAYDDVFRQGSFVVKHGSCTADASTIWSSTINDPDKWVSTTNQSTIASHFSTALSNETGWAVIQREAKATHSVGNEDFAAGDRYLTVLISANSSTELSFTTNGDYGKVLLPDTTVDVVQMALTGGSGSQPCEFKVIGSGVYQSAAYSPFGMEDNNSYVFSSLVRYDQVLVNFTINYPTGYEGELIPAEAPPAKYVAMGDSFSSGEGNPLFEVGTDENGVNECHRSGLAYPRLLEFDSSLSMGPTAFVACSGATTSNVLNGGSSDGAWDESQIGALSSDTEVITLTLGGNDVGFDLYATNCAIATCGTNTGAYSTILAAINGGLKSDLVDVYEEVLSLAPNATLYVVGYPQLVTDPYNDCVSFDFSNDVGARQVGDELNTVIENAVTEIQEDTNHPLNQNRMEYVEVNYTANPSPFEDHYLCSTESYFHDLDLDDQEFSFHPNTQGQQAYKELIEEVLN